MTIKPLVHVFGRLRELSTVQLEGLSSLAGAKGRETNGNGNGGNGSNGNGSNGNGNGGNGSNGN